MQENLVESSDQGVPDCGRWEDLDITPIAPVAGTRRAAVTLVGAMFVFGVLVGVGLWPIGSAAPPIEPATAVCIESASPAILDDAPADDLPPASASIKVAPTPSTDVLMPVEGEVVLGPRVAVAGHVHGLRSDRQIRPMSLSVSVVIGDEVVGQADIAVVSGQFIGALDVIEQVRGRVAELRVSDSLRPDRVIVTRSFVLGPAR